MKLELNEPLTKALRIDPEIRREKVGQMHCKGWGTADLKERSQDCKCGQSAPFTSRENGSFSAITILI